MYICICISILYTCIVLLYSIIIKYIYIINVGSYASGLCAGSVTRPTARAPTIAQCSSSSAEAPDTPIAPTTFLASSSTTTPPGTAANGWVYREGG